MWPCAVINCTKQSAKSGGNVSFYPFPLNAEACKKWLARCGRKVDLDSKDLLVCSSHFSTDEFEVENSGEHSKGPPKRRLRVGALPALNLFKIKQEPPDEDEIEVEEYEISNPNHPQMSCLNLPAPQTIAHNSKTNLDNSNFDSAPVTEINDSMEIITVESLASASSVIQIKEDPSLSSDQLPTSSSCINFIPSSLPASQNWPGKYDFTVSFGPQDKNTKGVSWTYSKIKDKLYVGKDLPCPVNFSANCVLPDDAIIRVLPLYSSPEHASAIVHRCINHSMEESKRGIIEAEHLVRCESDMARYEIDGTTKRQSVVVPFENPPVGQQYSTYIYKFTCYGSCAGGPNRRPLMLVFTLEVGGKVEGRRKLDVKICACPGRDRRGEEKLLEAENDSKVAGKRKDSETMDLSTVLDFTNSVSFPYIKRSKVQPNEDGLYTLTARDKECYEFLKQMKKFYEMCKTMKNLTPEMKKTLIQHNRLKGNGPVQDGM